MIDQRNYLNFPNKTAFNSVCGFILLIFFSGCTTLEIDRLRESTDLSSFQPVQLSVPFYAQEEFQCGPAALAMLLSWTDVDVTPQELKPLVYLPEKQGSFPVEIVAATRQFDRLPYVIEPSIAALFKELGAGNPVIVFQNLGLDWFPQWHFAVVTGVDVTNNQIVLNSGPIKNHKMTLDTFERTWSRADKWAMVAMKPGQLPVTASPARLIKAATYFERQNNLEFAKSFYESAVRRWPDKIMVLIALANISYQLGEFEIAGRYYQKSIELNPLFAPAHNNLAMVLMVQGKLLDAQRHAQRAVSLGGKRINNYQQTLLEIDQKLQAQAH